MPENINNGKMDLLINRSNGIRFHREIVQLLETEFVSVSMGYPGHPQEGELFLWVGTADQIVDHY
jgi:hypothetical protein